MSTCACACNHICIVCFYTCTCRAALRSSWALGLNTTDQEKERILNLTFAHFEGDPRTQVDIEIGKIPTGIFYLGTFPVMNRLYHFPLST